MEPFSQLFLFHYLQSDQFFFALKLKEPVALTSLNSFETNRLNIDVEVQLAPNYDHAEFKNIPPSRNSSNQTCAKNIISTLRQNLSK